MVVRQFLEMARFELSYYLRRISTWIYFGIFFAFAFLMMNAIGGAWRSVTMAVGGSGGNVFADSPHVLLMVTMAVNLFGVIVTAALLGNSVYRDYQTGIHPLFFTSPISRPAYLGGRFAGALLVNAIIFLGIPLGLWLGSLMPYLDRARFGAGSFGAFMHPYAVGILPTLVFTGAIFFSLAALTRQMLPNYVGGAVLLVGYMLSENLTRDLESQRVAAILDPFALNAISHLTRYWTPVERNTRLLPLEGEFLWNRLLWLSVGLAIFAVGYARFRFSHAASEGRRERQKGRQAAGLEPPPEPAPIQVPAATRSFGGPAHLLQYLSLTRLAFRGIVANRYFVAIVGAGLLFLVLSAEQVGKLYGTTTWPVTYAVLEVLGGTFAIFILVIITFYAGDLVWHEREARIQQVVDATPMRSWVPFLAKLTALGLVVAVLQALILLAGVLTQLSKGYTEFELGLYAQTLFGLQLVEYLLLCVLAMLVHVLVNNKYLGHLIVVLYFVLTLFMGQLGLEHNLYRYASDPGLTYSDMNGYGPFLAPFLWFKLYWGAWALLLALLTNLLWVRGEEQSARWRIRLARQRFTRSVIGSVGLAALLILVLGGFVFYNTNVLNDYQTSAQREQLAVDYERLYKRFEGIPQPRIAAVRLHVELYPERRDVEIRGEYRIENRTSKAIDSLHILIDPNLEIRELTIPGAAEPVLSDAAIGYHIYRLSTALQPGDTLPIHFALGYVTRGFPNRISNPVVVENGTFVNSGMMPRIGYDPRGELSDDEVRRKYDLKPKERMPPAHDIGARGNNYISMDSDWIDFEATLGTSPDQIALAPGYLQREWREGDRRYFHYRMDAPILGFYAFLSARYAIERDHWKDVPIEIYHHPGHEYNLGRMMEGVKRSLDYYTREFGPYQHRQVRILEFPRYMTFAQAFPNTIPFSEGIGFIARIEDNEEDIDYPFYVTAHEVAHQWWAHQVISARTQGATVLSETLSQYSALMVMEEEYGREQIGRFLRYELDRYLTGRTLERKKEMPLLRVEDQQYIHYRKGSLAMYALRDYIGEDRLNAALRDFLQDARFSGPPYPTVLDLYAHLRQATPDSLHYVLEDFFEEITLWDNRARTVTYAPTADGRWQVTLDVEARKVRADSLGNEREVPMDDLVDVGVFGPAPRGSKADGPLLYMQKHRIRSGRQQIRVMVDQRPARGGIDPHHKLIDRKIDDNTVTAQRP